MEKNRELLGCNLQVCKPSLKNKEWAQRQWQRQKQFNWQGILHVQSKEGPGATPHCGLQIAGRTGQQTFLPEEEVGYQL